MGDRQEWAVVQTDVKEFWRLQSELEDKKSRQEQDRVRKHWVIRSRWGA